MNNAKWSVFTFATYVVNRLHWWRNNSPLNTFSITAVHKFPVWTEFPWRQKFLPSIIWIICPGLILTGLEWGMNRRLNPIQTSVAIYCFILSGNDCPKRIGHGSVSTGCNLRPFTTCSYTCDPGYHPVTGVNALSCSRNGQWTPDIKSLCKGIVNNINKFIIKLSIHLYIVLCISRFTEVHNNNHVTNTLLFT